MKNKFKPGDVVITMDTLRKGEIGIISGIRESPVKNESIYYVDFDDRATATITESTLEKFSINSNYFTERHINPGWNRTATYPIYIYVPNGNEGPIPHMHVYHDKTLNPRKCSYIRLDKAEYSPHHDTIRLPRKLKNSFISVMTNIWHKRADGKAGGTTGYQIAVDTWMVTHGMAMDMPVDDDTGLWIMPPYNELP